MVAVSIALGVASGACAPRAGPADPGDPLVERLRSEGRFEDALAAARRGLDRVESSRDVPEWRRADARLRAATLARIVALPDSARHELAAAERVIPRRVGPEDDWRTLLPALERQLAARARWLGDDHPDAADTRSAMARLEWGLGNSVGARELDERALEARRRAFGTLHPRVVESLDQLADDIKLAGSSHVTAAAWRDSVLALGVRVYPAGSPEYATLVLKTANMHRWSGRPRDADRCFGEALGMRRRLFGDDSEAVAEVLSDWSVTLARFGRNREAAALARRALAILDRRGGPPRAIAAVALNTLGNALLLSGRFAEARPILERTAMVQEERRRASRADMGRAQMFSLVGWVDLAKAQIRLGDSLAALESLDRGLSRGLLERSLARAGPGAEPSWDRLAERVARTLPDTTAVLGWLDSPPFGTIGPNYWCFVIRRGAGLRWFGVEQRPTPARPSPAREVGDLRSQMVSAGMWPVRVAPNAALDSLVAGASRARFAPMEPALAGVRELVVASPTFHWGVPLEILRDADGRWLTDRFTVSYVPSLMTHVLGHEHAPAPRDPRDWSALLVGAPGDGLTGVPREVEDVRSRVAEATVLVNAAASEAAVRRLQARGELGRFDLIHIAGHQRGNRVFPRETALFLAEADSARLAAGGPATDASDGRLTPEEISGWTLGARLVMLASCQSGGTMWTRSEGALGVGPAAIEAGARAAVLSLWPVDDRATELFVERFYEALMPRGGPPGTIAGALRRARIEVREWRAPDGSRPFAHPAYWGGFVLLNGPG